MEKLRGQFDSPAMMEFFNQTLPAIDQQAKP
jgi:hypothetical protein